MKFVHSLGLVLGLGLLFLCRRHTLYGAKIVDITYDDRPKLLYYTINLGGRVRQSLFES